VSVKTIVIRHPNENLAKCSLTPLHGRPEIEFLVGGGDMRFDATGYVVLAVDSPVISTADAGHPLLLLDTTWVLLPKLINRLTGTPIYRSLPDAVRTAYPRVSKMHKDPAAGLASVEALYLARKLLGDDDLSLLDGYYWKDAFLEKLPSELK
jgi:pre-rRNA-processing protein TSR3